VDIAVFIPSEIKPAGKDSVNSMNPRDYKIASELKRRLGKAVELVDFKVYGSKARGDDDEFSDLDVFVEVAKLDSKTKDVISEIAWEIGLENSMVISPLVFSVDEAENSALRASPILLSIKEEGIGV
jgi:predicted nucleotidyltransferase